MSPTRREEIGRVGRVGRGCYEDPGDLSVTSCACRARGIRRTTRHADKQAVLCTAADRRLTSQVSAWQAERVSRPTREDIGDATRKLLPWNSSFRQL